MPITTKTLATCLLALFAMSACRAPKSYQRTYTYVPAVKDRGNVELLGAAALSHIEIAGAYSPIKYLNVQGQTFLGARSTGYEYGLGCYLPVEFFTLRVNGGFGEMDRKAQTFPWRTSTYTRGDTRTYFKHKSSFEKSFLQVSGEIDINERWRIGFGTRYNWIGYTDWETIQIEEIDGFSPSISNFPLLDRTSMVTDVFGQLTFTTEPCYINVQLGKTSDDFLDYSYPRYSEWYLNIGFGFTLNRMRDLWIF